MDVVLAVGRVAFEVNVAVVFHVFGHVANHEQLLHHLARELVFAGLLDGVVVEFEVVFVNDELHAGQFLHFAQLLHRELRLRDAAANEQVEFLRLVVLDALVHVVGNVGFRTQIVGVAHELARDVHRHIAATDHCDAFRFERPFAHAGRVAVVPLHKARGTVHAVEIGARNRERLVFDRTGREQNRVIPLQQILERHILAELDVGVQMDVRIIQRFLERRCNEFDRRMIRRHAIAHEAERHRQFLEQIDARVRAESEFVAELGELAQEDVGGVDAGRARANNSNTKFRILSHENRLAHTRESVKSRALDLSRWGKGWGDKPVRIVSGSSR